MTIMVIMLGHQPPASPFRHVVSVAYGGHKLAFAQEFFVSLEALDFKEGGWR